MVKTARADALSPFPTPDIIAISYSAMNLTLGSVSGFLPTIVSTCHGFLFSPESREILHLRRSLSTVAEGLGYTATDAQLYTVPPYATALGCSMSQRTQFIPALKNTDSFDFTVLLMTSLSDRLKSRGIFVVIVYCIGITGVSFPPSHLPPRRRL